ncbi:calcium-binding protein [Sulfitobacter sp. HNIBRBA2951]|uniref:calcium-binding protein n=1 Tax=Sulfitobacter aquimarinus TaxID=3158557 RepID=UPI0032DECC69
MLRAHLDAFIALDLTRLPTAIEETITYLGGVELASNNIFDASLNVQNLVQNIEIVAQISDSSFEIGPDSQTLVDYLEFANPDYHASFLSQEANLQSSIDAVFDRADGLTTSFSNDFAGTWEFISGTATAVYAGVIAGAGGLGDLAESAVSQVSDVSVGMIENFIDGFQDGRAVLRVAQVTELAGYYKSLWEGVTQLGDALSASLQAGNSPSEMLGELRVRQLITSIAQNANDATTVINSVSLPSSWEDALGALNTVLRLVTTLEQRDVLHTALENEDLSGLSRSFLEDAVFINNTEFVDFFADAVSQFVDMLNIGGQFALAATATLEVVRTFGDAFAIAYKTPWLQTNQVFEEYAPLTTYVTRYQDLLGNALEVADEAYEGTWGASLTSTIPERAPAAIAILSRRFDYDGDSAFEQGGLLAVGGTYYGNIPRFTTDQDWFEVVLEAGQDYEISLTTTTSQNAEFILYDREGREIAQDNPELRSSTQAVAQGTVFETGTYFISVDTSGSADDYAIRVAETTLPSDVTELIASTDLTTTPTTLGVGETFTGYMNRDYAQYDWIRVELEQGTTYSMELTGGGFFPQMVLFNQFGGALVGFDRTVNGTIIEGTAVIGGTYFVGVTNSWTAEYTLTLNEVVNAVGVSELQDAAASTRTVYDLNVGEVFRGTMDSFSPQSDDGGQEGEGDWMAVTLVEGRSYRFTASVDVGGIDMDLRNSAGDIVAVENDRLSSPGVAILEGTALSSGQFFVDLHSAYYEDYQFTYEEVSLPTTYTELIDAGESSLTPYHLDSGESFAGRLEREDNDQQTSDAINGDWIAVDLTAGVTFVSTLTSVNLSRANFGLFAADGSFITEVDGDYLSQGAVTLTSSVAQSGTYYLVVGGTGAGSYTLTFDIGTATRNGTAVADVVEGTVLDDVLFGLGGDDTLNGGDGDDVLNGGSPSMLSNADGADVFNGGAGSDTVSYAGSFGSLRVDLWFPSQNTFAAAGDTFISIENLTGSQGADNLRGTQGNNVLSGERNVDYIFGRAGDDEIYGGIGNDVLFGGVGADMLSGGENFDRAQYSESLTAIRADLADASLNTGEAAGDVYTDIEGLAGSRFADDLRGDANANQLFGREDADQLTGRAGDDYINGGGGQDTLRGGLDNDTLRGGASRDTFVFDDGHDVIEDWALDIVQFDSALWGGQPQSAAQILGFAQVEAGNTVFDFGQGNTLTLEGIVTPDQLAPYIDSF